MTKKYRTEQDLLGTKKVPDCSYYGVQTIRAKENFNITGHTINSEIISAVAIIKKAAAIANMETGHLGYTIGNAIKKVTNEIINGKWHDEFIVDPIQGGAGTSINMNANEVIANRALELIGRKKGEYNIIHPNNHVNMSQSTNDVMPTAIRIAIIQLLVKLEEEMTKLKKTFDAKGQEFNHIIKAGRTHLQDAVPIRLGQEFTAYGQVLSRDIKRINRLYNNLLKINLGATAIGTKLNAEPMYISKVVKNLQKETLFPFASASNLIDATQNTDVYTEVSSMVKICMTNMSKIANDLRLMGSGPNTGFAEIKIPEKQPGSSIMPGKVNPVICEVVNQVAFQVLGNDHTITMASEAGQLEINVMEPIIYHNLHQSLHITVQALKVFNNSCVKEIKANFEQCETYVEESVGIITALNPHVGYKAASDIAKESLKTKTPIREIVLRDK